MTSMIENHEEIYDIEKIKNTVINGDCIEVMSKFPSNSIDTLICDPPYNIGFMGNQWDVIRNYQKWTTKWAKEALRVAKPGSTLLCFGGTRTWHRLACGLEDAGWMIKDTIIWIYAEGFPKSLNIGKAITKEIEKELKKQGVKGEIEWTD